MCIAIMKPAGVKMPSTPILNTCAKANPQGAGFAYYESGKLIVQKSTDSKRIIGILEAGNFDNKNVIIHFRIATAGTVNDANCHPFSSENIAFCHNGIIRGKGSKTQTDSEELFLSIVMPILKCNLPEKVKHEIIKDIADSHSSKFILMDKTKFQLYGNFLTDAGVFYSNNTYKEYKQYSGTVKPYGRNWNDWNDSPNYGYCEVCNEWGYLTDINGIKAHFACHNTKSCTTPPNTYYYD